MRGKLVIALTLALVGGFVLYLYSSDVFAVDPKQIPTSPKLSSGVSPGDAEVPKTDASNKEESKKDDSGKEESKKDGLESTVRTDSYGLKVVTNPDDLLVLANKKHNLPADYEPTDLVYLTIPFPFKGDSPIRYLRKEAAAAIDQLFAAAKKEGINLVGKSGYRSYSIQKRLFAENVAAKGEAEASKFSARPGQSEHQTGLALDVTTADLGYALKQSFGATNAGRWVAENAYKYGFIIRYPKGKEDITGYSYEPWHLRYVGVEAAKKINENNLTLEEYLGLTLTQR